MIQFCINYGKIQIHTISVNYLCQLPVKVYKGWLYKVLGRVVGLLMLLQFCNVNVWGDEEMPTQELK